MQTGNGKINLFVTCGHANYKIKLRIKTISEVLEALTKQKVDKSTAAEARGLLVHLNKASFLMCLLTVEVILSKVNAASEELQNSRIDFIVAMNLISMTQRELLSLRSEKFWSDISEEAGVLHRAINCAESESSMSASRRKAHPKMLVDYFTLSTTGERESLSEEA